MDDLSRQILSARKPTILRGLPDSSTATGETASIAPQSYSSFGIYDIKKNTQSLPKMPTTPNQAHVWTDDLLRIVAGRQERVILAVRDAARQVEKKRLNPMIDDIYVTSSIRKAWNLSSDQMSKGLKALVGSGSIRFTNQKKGRHVRFILRTLCLNTTDAKILNHTES